MSLKRKRVSLAETLADARAAFRALAIDQPAAWLAVARERTRNLPKTNFDLGCDFAARGQWMDALFRFRVAAYFAPDYPKLWYNLGCCYYRTGNRVKAVEALKKALTQNPQHTEARFMLAALAPELLAPADRPTRLPPEMIREFFSARADSYDIDEAQSQYQGGKVAYDVLVPLLKTAAPRVVDLGCGTGIAARPWRESAATITGVDLTPAMLALAEKASHANKKLFDTLLTEDLATLIVGLVASSFDVALVVNVVPFLGELTGLFRNAAAALAPGGALLITTEPFADAGFGLSPESGRFGHSAEYVTQTAKAAGLTLAKTLSLALYAENETPAFIFTKVVNG